MMDGLTITLDEPHSGDGPIDPACLANARTIESYEVGGLSLE
jgi:hypothetical protein